MSKGRFIAVSSHWSLSAVFSSWGLLHKISWAIARFLRCSWQWWFRSWSSRFWPWRW